MLRSLSHGTTILALTLIWLAAAWAVGDVLFADPAVLVFEEVAILFAILAPVVYLLGWGLRWLSLRFGNGGAVSRV